MEIILREVRKKLDTVKYYSMNDSWLRDCVEYYTSEHNNSNPNEVFDFVVAQWQLSNLREISNEKACLPRNLANQQCTTLNGQFMLQMEKIYNIAESRYKQLEKIRNTRNENDEIAEGEKSQAAWEPKKNRMLYLHLTDGVQDVTAMEYKPIKSLNDSLLPGYKLLIKGPIICRRGVLLLDETNIKEIGGEVDSMIVPNAVENVLARALNLPENPDPYKDAVEKTTQREELPFDNEFDIDMEDLVLIEESNYRENRPNDVRVESSRNSEIPRHTAPDPPVEIQDRSESDLMFEQIDEALFEDVMEILPAPQISPQKKFQNPSAGLARNPAQSRRMEFVEVEKPANREKSFHVTEKSIRNDQNDRRNLPTPKRPEGMVSTEFVPSTGTKRCASPPTSAPAGKMYCLKNGDIKKSSPVVNKKITDYLKKDSAPQAAPSDRKTYDLICDLHNVNITSGVSLKTVHGKVTKFDKLSRNGELWQLSATITDHTGSIDTELSPKILETMLGFSVPEFTQKKKLKKANPEIENFLRQGFRNAEKKIMELNGVLRIELAPKKKPVVVEIIDNR